jgi:hypothetical protein
MPDGNEIENHTLEGTLSGDGQGGSRSLGKTFERFSFQEVVEMMIRHPNLWSLVYALFEHWDNKPREANRKDFFLCLRGPEASGRVASGEDTNGALERAVCAFGNLNES